MAAMFRDIAFIALMFAVVGFWAYLAFSHPSYTVQEMLVTFWRWYALGVTAIWAAPWSAYGRRE